MDMKKLFGLVDIDENEAIQILPHHFVDKIKKGNLLINGLITK